MPNYSRSNYSKKALLTLKNIGKTLKISILGLHYTYVAANKKQIFPTRFLCFLSPAPFFSLAFLILKFYIHTDFPFSPMINIIVYYCSSS